jgi:hypothetical protein
MTKNQTSGSKDRESDYAGTITGNNRLTPTALRNIFDAIDDDGGGTLDLDELLNFARLLKPKQPMGRTRVVAIMAEMGAAPGGEISFEEFQEWWRSGGGDNFKPPGSESGAFANDPHSATLLSTITDQRTKTAIERIVRIMQLLSSFFMPL